jgi:hypothetical protein
VIEDGHARSEREAAVADELKRAGIGDIEIAADLNRLLRGPACSTRAPPPGRKLKRTFSAKKPTLQKRKPFSHLGQQRQLS